MANSNWLARAKARVEVQTCQVTAYDAATTYSIICNGMAVTTIAAGSVNATATALAAAWNAATQIEFTEVTASASTDTVTLTCDTAGLPFTVTTSESGGAGTIGDPVITTAATGPNHYNDVNNWTEGSVPAGADVVEVDLTLGSILYGLSNAGATLTSMHVISSGQTENTIGLPARNAGGYTEYRTTELTIDVTTLIIRAQSSRLRFNVGSVLCTCEVRELGQATEQNAPAMTLRGTNTSNAIDIQSGKVGLAYYNGDSYTPATVKVAPNGEVVLGVGCVVQTQLDSLGTVLSNGTIPTLLVGGGVADIRGTGPSTTITGTGGRIICKWGGTTTAVGLKNCVLDATDDLTARTFSTTTLNEGASIIDPHRTITHTAIARGSGVTQLSAA